MSPSSYPITNSAHVRGEHPPGEDRAAPPTEVSPVAPQVTAVLLAMGVLIAALFVAIVVLAQSRTPAGASVEVTIAAAGLVVVVAGTGIAVRLTWRRRSVPVAVPPAEIRDESSPVEADSSSPPYPQVLKTLSLRLRSLNGNAINKIEELEGTVDDPALLKMIFAIDHLATRMRRQAENLAVIGGNVLQHRKSRPLPVGNVLRAAAAETEHYPQIMIVEAADTHVRGYAVPEVIHLLAELMENATTFTNPHSPKVVVRGTAVKAGIAIEIQDRGLGIPADRLCALNALLDGSLDVDLGDVVSESRIGLTVVRHLASRHEIRVKLQTNIYGGTDAVVVLPHALLAAAEQLAEPERRTPRPFPEEAPRPQPQLHQQPRPAPVPQQLVATPMHGEAAFGRPAASANMLPPSPSPRDTGPQRAVPAQLEPLPRRIPATTPAQSPPITGNLDQAPPVDQAPPLPQRTGTHLHHGLLEPPSNPEPTGVHNSQLLEDFRAGRQRHDAEHGASTGTGPLPQISQTDEGQNQ